MKVEYKIKIQPPPSKRIQGLWDFEMFWTCPPLSKIWDLGILTVLELRNKSGTMTPLPKKRKIWKFF